MPRRHKHQHHTPGLYHMPPELQMLHASASMQHLQMHQLSHHALGLPGPVYQPPQPQVQVPQVQVPQLQGVAALQQAAQQAGAGAAAGAGGPALPAPNPRPHPACPHHAAPKLRLNYHP